MPTVSKAELRGTYKKLRIVPCGWGDVENASWIAQEALDFLSLLAGLRPVYVLGRRFNDPSWEDGVLRLAIDAKLPVIEGPYWQDGSVLAGFPPWYANVVKRELGSFRVHYIAANPVIAQAVRTAAATGRPSVEDEARFFGYPKCCVAAQRERVREFHETWFGELCRAAKRDPAELRKRKDTEPPVPANPQAYEAALAEAMSETTPCPFTSFNMCETCAGGTESPAFKLAERNAAFASAIDPELFEMLSRDWDEEEAD